MEQPDKGNAIYWVDRPVEVRAEGGIVIATVCSGDTMREYRSTPAILVATMGNIARCYAGILADRGAKVIPMARRRR